LTFLPCELCLQGDPKAGEVTNEEVKSEPKSTTIPSYISVDTDTQMIDQLPQVEIIGMILLLLIIYFSLDQAIAVA